MKQRNSETIRFCKNKVCHKQLPDGYKYKYCEACRNNQIQKAKKFGKGIMSAAGAFVLFATAIVTKGMINPKK